MLPIKDENPTYRRAWVTVVLVVVNIVVFVFVQQRSGVEQITLPDGTPAVIDASTRFTFEYAAIPCELTEGRPLDVAEVAATLRGNDTACEDTASPPLFAGKSVWLAALTSMFLHGDWFHLGFNMVFLWIFGNNIEDHLGVVRYLVFYVAAGIAALGTHVALQLDSSIPVIGASGAIAGVMGAYLVWFPTARVRTLVFMFFVFFVRIPAVGLLSLWFVTQFFTGQDSGVAWAAHVGGFVFGAIVGALVRYTPGMTRLAWVEPHRSERTWAGRTDGHYR